MKNNNQANSFPCKICKEIFTEESGAYEGFTCENCLNDERELDQADPYL
jgi:hypothetical protein